MKSATAASSVLVGAVLRLLITFMSSKAVR